MHSTIEKVTQRIIERSRPTREDYLQRMAQAATRGALLR